MNINEKRNVEYKSIIKGLAPLITKHGKDKLRWALNRWAKTESHKKSLLKQKQEIEKELSRI